jgi:hypothetical protein
MSPGEKQLLRDKPFKIHQCIMLREMDGRLAVVELRGSQKKTRISPRWKKKGTETRNKRQKSYARKRVRDNTKGSEENGAQSAP